MLQLKYPNYPFKIKGATDQELIFDDIRKKWFRLTPEEWVRQNIIQYLIQVLQYPAALMAIEKEIKLGELKKRCDIVIYKDNQPWMIVECKELNVPMSEAVLQQILNYNMTLKVPFIAISNGNQTWLAETQTRQWLAEFPKW